MKNNYVYLEDALESIALIKRYIEGVNFDEFESNPEKQDSVMRRIELIGEALSKTSNEFRAHYSQLPWRVAIGMRNFLIHDYAKVDLRRVWDTAIGDLKNLQEQLEEILKGQGH